MCCDTIIEYFAGKDRARVSAVLNCLSSWTRCLLAMVLPHWCDTLFCLLCFVCLFWERLRMTSPRLGCPCWAHLHLMMSTYLIHPIQRLCLTHILKKSKKHLVVSHLWILASYQMNLLKKIKTRLSLEASMKLKKIIKLKVSKVCCHYLANRKLAWA